MKRPHPKSGPLWQQARAAQQAGHLQQAEKLARQALGQHPGHHGILALLGTISMQRGQSQHAVTWFQQACVAQPDALNHYNLAVALQASGQLPNARNHYQDALQLKPGFAPAWNNLGNVQEALGLISDAQHCFQQAIRFNPSYTEAYNNLARALKDSGDYAGAVKHYRQARSLQPNNAVVHSNLLFLLSYNVLCNPQELLAAHQAWDQAHGGGPERAQTFRHDRHDDPERRLRIGYVSPDFKQHAASYFFEPLLAAHDRQQVEVFCYAEVNNPDAVTQRLQIQANHWCTTIGMSDEALAQRICADGIDILIDLAGHTAGNRLKAFTYKPAPVQASYLGYCTTTGLATMDYWLTDTILYPEHSPELIAETPWRLDRCWLCYRPAADAPAVVMPQHDHITFGSLNELSKLTSTVIAVWSEILRTLPRSRLLLKTRALTDPAMQQQITARFAEQGIASERLRLLPHSADYLPVYQTIDIALDPFPRTGGATTADALWMGVPVITLAGERCIERQGMGMLSAVGLEELITSSREDYIACALALAEDHDRRRHLRSSLRRRMADSPLCDAASLAHTLEHAYRQMWRRFLSGKKH